MLYTCNKCNKIFTQISHYKKHLERKNPCDKNIIYKTDIVTSQKILSPENVILPPENIIDTNSNTLKVIKCNYCNKIFARKDNLKKHLKNRCTIKKNQELDEDKIIKERNEDFKEEIMILKEEIQKLKEEMSKLKKVKSLKNTDNIIQLGNEELYNIFKKEEQILILNKGFCCLDYLVEYTHFNNNYPQYKNILITNLQNDIAYKFNSTKNKFYAVIKEDLLSSLIDERLNDISEFYNKNKDDINVKIEPIEQFLEKMKDDIYRKNKEKEIKIIMYNNKNKVKRY